MRHVRGFSGKSDETAREQRGGRYSVFPSGELHIRHVTPEDGALPYRCETSHLLSGESRVSSAAGRLLVTSPQNPVAPRITDSRSHVQASYGQPVELPCAAQGHPLPTYTWFRSQGPSSAPVQLDRRVRQVGGSLYVGGALLEDSGRYVCVVNNSAGAERASTSLLVTSALSARLFPQQQTVDVGRSAQLNCSTAGHPQLAVSWLKDGRPVHPSSRVRLVSPQILRIERMERSDAGMYQCVVSNNDDAAQGTAQVSLQDAAPQLVRTFGAATLEAGAPWSAECEAAGSPLPSVSWRRDGRALASSQRHSLQVSVEAGRSSVVGRLRLAAGAASHAAPLRVLGPPHAAPMPDRRVVAHTDAAFHCRVTGFPISEIRWQREGITLPKNHRQQVFQNGTLIIRNMQKHLDEGGYVCVATNPDGLTARSKLNIQVMEPPEIDPIATKPDLQKGMRTHLSCVVSKGDLPMEIRWLKDGAPLPADAEVSQRPVDDYSSTLSFRSLAPRHAGNYSCHASNAAASSRHTVQLVVNEPPSWKRQPKDTTVEAGRSVVLHCSADGSPPPRILWKKDAGSSPPHFLDVSLLMSNYKILANGSLWIRSARSVDKGHFLCQATNGFGIGLSKVVHLDVHLPARFHRPFQNITAIQGSSATLDCTADGDKPVSINWFQNGHRFDATLHERVTAEEIALPNGVAAKLEFERLQRTDTARFVCIAANKYGSDRSEILLVVQEPPETPVNFHVSNYSSRSVSLAWEPPYDGNSRITHYVVQYKNTSVTWHWNVAQVLVQGDQQNVTVAGLLPAHAYHFRALASNSIGTSNATSVLSVTTEEEPPESPPRDVKVRTKSSESLLVTWKVLVFKLSAREWQ
ncbi:Down syndrome cell adhesion molecule-like protein Dscam2 [Schistocerca piceifrons]|uniref:Down syndrome cell adhesion molecule-like protein Dscam2 n=1 Tax=Schistocerca piceifrons TaxID=274613 RepID=UPI001F5E64F6|nr:Down syndrome cell adhesion molecule-like protein Dscam2 [Schistocerca piceifrons]